MQRVTRSSKRKEKDNKMTQFIYSEAVLSYVADRADSDKNKQKMQRVAALARKENVIAFLDSSKVSLVRFDKRAMYATEKVIKLVSAVAAQQVNIADFNENAFATIKTALLCSDAKENMLFSDIEAAMSKDVKLDEKRKAFVYRRNALQSDATVNAQAQQCRDMLKTLNIAREVSKNTFEIVETDFLATCRVKLAELTL